MHLKKLKLLNLSSLVYVDVIMGLPDGSVVEVMLSCSVGCFFKI